MALTLKMFSLAVKTLAKPVATVMKSRLVESSQTSSTYVYVGQFSHQVWSKLQIRAAGHQGKLKIKPLDDATALKDGVDVLSEAFVFLVAGTCLGLEVSNNMKAKADAANAKKEEDSRKQMDRDEQIASINRRLNSMIAAVRDTERILEAAGTQ